MAHGRRNPYPPATRRTPGERAVLGDDEPPKAKPPRANGKPSVRLTLQLYDAKACRYHDAGMAVPGIEMRSRAELDRLWEMLREVIMDRRWTDSFQAFVTAPSIASQLKVD